MGEKKEESRGERMDEWMVILMFYNTATKPGALAPSRGQTKTDMSSPLQEAGY